MAGVFAKPIKVLRTTVLIRADRSTSRGQKKSLTGSVDVGHPVCAKPISTSAAYSAANK